MLVVLRNRVYLGEVFYRDRWYRADEHHPPLITEKLFAEAEQILIARGDDHTHRVAARSDYPLAGLIFCAHCGKRYQGTSARGNRYTYRYYTCFTRQRYGTTGCAAERLPAEQVERGVIDSMLATLARTDLIEAALGEAQDEATADRATHTSELAAVETEIAKTEAAIGRYLTAFENGTMPEATCAPRVDALSRKTAELRSRRDELALLIDETPTLATPSREHLDALHEHIRNQTATGMPDAVQALLQAITVKIDVRSRSNITPTFRIPAAPATPTAATAETNPKVRTLPSLVPPAGFEPALPPPEGWAHELARAPVTRPFPAWVRAAVRTSARIQHGCPSKPPNGWEGASSEHGG